MASQIGAVNRSKNGRVSSPNQPQGSRAILNFGANSVGKSFIYPFDHDENGDDFFDEFLNQPEKKRRLSMDHVQFLEKCFVADNKLDPDRKIQIAKELGLQPRQITIWFQNRRARWKTRQLETDYEALHRNYQRLKAEYDDLFSDHQKLKAEVLCLKTNVESELQTQGYEGSSRRGMADDLEVSAMISRNESKSSMISDEIYEDSLLFSAGLSCALESDHPNPIPDLDDESPRLSKVEFSHYLPNGNGFYFEFPMEDPALSYWFV